jgi:putative endonuclease
MAELLSIIQKHKRSSAQSKNELGERGEFLAANYLSNAGYRIVMTNFKVPVGRNSKGVQVTGEIDIIALDGPVLCFIEVKTRRSEDFAPAIAAVDAGKQRQIVRTARMYRKLFAIRDIPIRYDAITLVIPDGGEPKIELTKGFWNESKFRKRRWADEQF